MDSNSAANILKEEKSKHPDSKKFKLLEYQYELETMEKRLKTLLDKIYETMMEISEDIHPKLDYFGGKQYDMEKTSRTMKGSYCSKDFSTFSKKVKNDILETTPIIPKQMSASNKLFSKPELTKDIFKALIITGFGTGIVATLFFGFIVGPIIGALSAGLNIHAVIYRNNNYSEFFSDED